MRIFARLEDTGINETNIEPVCISLKPFEGECYFIDVTDKPINIDIFDDYYGNWNVYTGLKYLGNYFRNENTGEYIDSPIVTFNNGKMTFENEITIDSWDDKYDDWREYKCYQEYKNGEPIGKPYFEEY